MNHLIKKFKIAQMLGWMLIIVSGMTFGYVISADAAEIPGTLSGVGNLSEFDKVNLILDRYKEVDATVISNGIPYKIKIMWREAKKSILANHARITDAGSWIRTYFYRTPQGNILYMQYPGGHKLPLRDIFLSELALINGRVS